MNYSSYQNQLFVGHELYDTIRNLTFDQWLSSIPYPQEHWYWVDMKNLNQDNADAIANIILMSAKKYGIRNKLMVEHTNEKALKVVKQNGLFVMLWVENIYWSQMSVEQWKEFTQQQIDYLQPDALSCEYRMYPLLPQTFPTHNIHFWHTPAKYTPENVAFTREMCQDTSIKIVLVDYDKPISY